MKLLQSSFNKARFLINGDCRAWAILISLTLYGWELLFFLAMPVQDKLNVGVLWLTVLVIFYYTTETKLLRKATENELRLQIEVSKNDFMPSVVPVTSVFSLEDGKVG
jgi:hypothetical protein